jgi:hypothetical protein
VLLTPRCALDLQDGTQKSQKVFVIVPTSVGATEAEEIGAGAPLPSGLSVGGGAPCVTGAGARQAWNTCCGTSRMRL